MSSLTSSVYFADVSSGYCYSGPTKLLRNLSRLLVRIGQEAVVSHLVIFYFFFPSLEKTNIRSLHLCKK